MAALVLGSALLLASPAARGNEDPPREHHNGISIRGNGQFDRAHGVRSGSGTTADPYVISGWDVDFVEIKDTTRAVRLHDNMIGSLILDWIGARVDVRHNDISDLRVNQNVKRTKAPTSGTIAHNTIGVVGQLRHFDGMFMHNTVGDPTGQVWPWDVRAVNFDGFNGAHFAHNTIYGTMEARLHGHHHSTGFGRNSHMHAGKAHHGTIDHTKRWHEVFIHDNRIVTRAATALIYLDTNHAGNDRTATSETDPDLEKRHTHFTRVHIVNNELVGGGLAVNVFNARDDRHKRYERGTVRIVGNDISLDHGTLYPFEVRNGIEIHDARSLTLRIVDNVVRAPAARGGVWPAAWENPGAGLRMGLLERASIVVDGLTVTNRRSGIEAYSFKSVRWSVRGLRMDGVEQRLATDDSAGSPEER
jgi:hypothetical protein